MNKLNLLIVLLIPTIAIAAIIVDARGDGSMVRTILSLSILSAILVLVFFLLKRARKLLASFSLSLSFIVSVVAFLVAVDHTFPPLLEPHRFIFFVFLVLIGYAQVVMDLVEMKNERNGL